MTDCSKIDEYRAKLAAAEAAYHNLMTGESARVVVDQNGERVEFTAINAVRLQNYIRSLADDIRLCELGRPVVSGPMGVLF